jgi:acyl-CoA thioesterase
MTRIDADVARRAFEDALEHHEQAFGRFFLAKFLGFEITYPQDACRVEFPAPDFMFNPQGSLHGGIIALAMDVSMGHLLNRLQGPGATLEMKVQYLRPVRGGRAIATGRVLRRGSSVAFLESRLTDQDGELAAIATSTWKTFPPRRVGAAPD